MISEECEPLGHQMPLGQPRDIDVHHPVLSRDHPVRKTARAHEQVATDRRGAHGSAQPLEQQIEAAALDLQVSQVFHGRAVRLSTRHSSRRRRRELLVGSGDGGEAPEFGVHRPDPRGCAEFGLDAREVVRVQQIVVVEEADPVRPGERDSRVPRGRNPRLVDGRQLDGLVAQRRGGRIADPIGHHHDLIERTTLPERAVDGLGDEVDALVGRDHERERQRALFADAVITDHRAPSTDDAAIRGIFSPPSDQPSPESAGWSGSIQLDSSCEQRRTGCRPSQHTLTASRSRPSRPIRPWEPRHIRSRSPVARARRWTSRRRPVEV